MLKQNVIIFKVIKLTPSRKRAWCETNIGLIKKPTNNISSIALQAFLAREQEECWEKERGIPNCECRSPKRGRKNYIEKVKGNYGHCVNCGGKIWT